LQQESAFIRLFEHCVENDKSLMILELAQGFEVPFDVSEIDEELLHLYNNILYIKGVVISKIALRARILRFTNSYPPSLLPTLYAKIVILLSLAATLAPVSTIWLYPDCSRGTFKDIQLVRES
jgi:hypothetical protein